MRALGQLSEQDATFRSQPLPVGDAILWGPASADPPQPLAEPYPIFLHQAPLAQILSHTRSAPDKTLLGFLLGELCECPLSGIQYVVIRDVLCVRADAPGDRTASLLAGLWSHLQQQVQSDPRRLIGWYHSHPAGSLTLSQEDIGAHTTYFPAPWQVGLVLGRGGNGSVAAWFRATAARDWHRLQLPFYQVVPAQQADHAGTRLTPAPWTNFTRYRGARPRTRPGSRANRRARRLALRTTSLRSAQSPAPLPAPLPLPAPVRDSAGSRVLVVPRSLAPGDREGAEQELPARLSGTLRRTSGVVTIPDRVELRAPVVKRSRTWLVAVAASAITALVVAAGWALGVVRFNGPARSTAAPADGAPQPAVAPAPPVSPALAALDLFADSVQSALAEYQRRQAGFHRQRVRCGQLAQALVVVENRWMRYNARGTPHDMTLDADRAARDRQLYAAVDSVESDFQRSACPRP